MSIDFNESFKNAYNIMEHSNKNVFITGRAGTGKSTLLNYFRDNSKKNVVILAPTGVAAVNVGGQTIHSFFKFKVTVTVESIKRMRNPDPIYKQIDTIVIDEISMVRADLLDCIDRFMRYHGKNSNAPFGGVQLIVIGDLYQLPPVVPYAEKQIFETHYKSPYFFSAKCFENIDIEVIELEKIYRQKDREFIDLLNAIRNKTTSSQQLQTLNQRLNVNFNPDPEECYVYLTPRNADANDINESKLEQLTDEAHFYEAKLSGNYGREYFPVPTSLKIKEKAQVMMTNNDPQGRWINGTMGKVLKIQKRDGVDFIIVKLEDDTVVEVKPHKWDISGFCLCDGVIEAQKMGSFTHYPIILAWALTIHKSQGKTFQKLVLDIGRGAFSAGQVYVALSRCVSLEGLVLKKPILNHHIWTDAEIEKFLSAEKGKAKAVSLFE